MEGSSVRDDISYVSVGKSMENSTPDRLLLAAAQRSLKHAMVDLDEAIDLLRRDDPIRAHGLLRRLSKVLDEIAHVLEQNSVPPSTTT